MTICFVPAATDPVRVRKGLAFQTAFFGFEPEPFDPSTIHRAGERPAFQKCLADVLRLQDSLPWDRGDPTTWQAKKLFMAVRENLPPDIKEQLWICPALGTILDYEFGTDGFFILKGNLFCPVTFDLTISRCTRMEGMRQRLKAHGYITPKDIGRNQRVSIIGQAAARHLVKPEMRRRILW